MITSPHDNSSQPVVSRDVFSLLTPHTKVSKLSDLKAARANLDHVICLAQEYGGHVPVAAVERLDKSLDRLGVHYLRGPLSEPVQLMLDGVEAGDPEAVPLLKEFGRVAAAMRSSTFV